MEHRASSRDDIQHIKPAIAFILFYLHLTYKINIYIYIYISAPKLVSSGDALKMFTHYVTDTITIPIIFSFVRIQV
jgi:hypothetical protein